VEDVELAAKYGAEAVILSNHGGRSLDFSPPPIDVLYELRQTKPELLSEVEVWIDGGVRRGTDVVKGPSCSRPSHPPSRPSVTEPHPVSVPAAAALCLGAKAVGLGRSFLYGNATYGQEGAEKVIQSASLP
jgi:L-lactate dehydrogenase (cytochrome)